MKNNKLEITLRDRIYVFKTALPSDFQEWYHLIDAKIEQIRHNTNMAILKEKINDAQLKLILPMEACYSEMNM